MNEAMFYIFYIGINIGKRNHGAGLIDDQGNHVGKTTRFAKFKDGSDAYLITQVIRIDAPEETPFLEEDLLQLRHLIVFAFLLSINVLT